MQAVRYDNRKQVGDLEQGRGGVEALVLLSLFNEAPAHPDDPVPANHERTGYWADALLGRELPTGSRLWVCHYMSPRRAVGFAPRAAREALQWMLDANLLGDVETVARRQGDEGVVLEVWARQPDEVAPRKLGLWEVRTNGGT